MSCIRFRKLWLLIPFLTMSAATAQVTNPPPMARVAATLVDPKATPAARALMSRLAADYGKRTWSALKLTNDVAQIFTNAGRKPVIISGDFMSYSPGRSDHGTNANKHVEKMIALHNEGYINAMDWHWDAPTNPPLNSPTNSADAARRSKGGFMAKDTTFDIAATLANTNSPVYACLLRDINVAGAQLKKFADANIPVLWRPLHEADGKWFWWGAKGPEACKGLWRLIFTRLTGYHHLHNLIWVYTPANPTRDEWYPGDDVVDIIGLDAYPKSPDDLLVSKWQDLQARYGGKKLVALTEFGGVPDIEAMHKAGVWWCYFSSWNHTLNKSPLEMLIRTYRSPDVITLGDLETAPANRKSNEK